MKILISAPYIIPVIERFRPLLEEKGLELVLPSVHERLEEADLLPLVGDIHGAICGDDRFTERVLAAAPHLKVISKWGTGIDSIDQVACQARGVAVRNTPNAFTEPVADSVLGYMLSFARRIPWMNEQMKAGIWDKLPGWALHESTLGIIGVGNIGKAVARRAKAFNMTILGHDLVEMSADFLAETGIQMMPKADLLTLADFVVLACTLNPTSYHILSASEFEQMKNTVILINAARGPLIDESALIEALKQEQIGGVALDVYEEEPLPAHSLLRRFANVMLAPHNANSSPSAWEHVHHNTIQNLLTELGL